MTAPAPLSFNRETPAGTTLGREWLGLDPASGKYQLRFVARPEFLNRHGTVQGGFLCAMLDSAAGMALGTALQPGQSAVTRNLNTTFIKPAAAGTLLARASIESIDEREAIIDVELINPDGVLLTQAKATMRILNRRVTVDR